VNQDTLKIKNGINNPKFVECYHKLSPLLNVSILETSQTKTKLLLIMWEVKYKLYMLKKF